MKGVKKLEVGSVYGNEKSSRIPLYYLAATENVLFRVCNGSVITIARREEHRVVRGLSVGELCTIWGIELHHMDTIMDSFLNQASYRNKGVRQRSRPSVGPVNDELTETRLRITFRLSL